MARVVDILGEVSGILGVPILTPEYEIALTLLDRPDLTADQLIDCSSLSRAGFFNTIDRLKMWGIVVCDRNGADRRCKHYQLDAPVKAMILSTFEKYRSRHHIVYDRADHQSYLADRVQARRTGSRLDHISCEFQILLFLSLMPGSSNSDLQELVASSSSKFNRILSEMCGKGLVYFKGDENDRRRKLYYVSDAALGTLEQLHQQIFAWLDSRAAAAGEPADPDPPGP